MKNFFARFYLDFKKVVYILLVSVFIGLALLPGYDVLEMLELKAHDFRMISDWLRPPAPPPAGNKTGQAVLVEIDDASLNAIKETEGESWPWPRKLYARVIDILKDKGAALVGIDVYFITPSKYGAEDDRELARAIGEAGNVVLASYFFIPEGGNLQMMEPIVDFKARAADTGFSFGPFDRDNVLRKIMLFDAKHGEHRNSFALSLLENYLSRTTPKRYSRTDELTLEFPAPEAAELMPRKLKIPVVKEEIKSSEEIDTLRVNFSLPLFINEGISFVKVLKGEYPIDVFQDKIVIIGPTAVVLHDIYYTPAGPTPGVIIQTAAMNTMLSQAYISRVPRSVDIAIHFLCAALTAFVVMIASPIIGVLFTVALLVSYAMVNCFIFARTSVWFNAVNPLLAITLSYIVITLLKLIWSTLENMKLYKLAITDGLTDLFVHKYFKLKLNEERNRAMRHGLPLSLLITDIDHFKSFNDTYGHQTGDDVLKVFAATMKKSCRGTDTVARYGGEEFAVIMPHTDHQGALNMAERVRANVEKTKVPYKDSFLQVTTSIGVSTLDPGENTDCDQLIKQADLSLYNAKETGRNKVVGYPDIKDRVQET